MKLTIYLHSMHLIFDRSFPIIPLCRDGGSSRGSPCTETLLGGTDLHHHLIDSLLSLVLYYATNTMEKHNPELETQCLDTLHSMWTGAVIVELTLTH